MARHDRQAVLDALYGCVTRDEAQDALALADAWVKAHPDDLDVRHVMEQAVLVRDAWDLGLVAPEDQAALLRDQARRIRADEARRAWNAELRQAIRAAKGLGDPAGDPGRPRNRVYDIQAQYRAAVLAARDATGRDHPPTATIAANWPNPGGVHDWPGIHERTVRKHRALLLKHGLLDPM